MRILYYKISGRGLKSGGARAPAAPASSAPMLYRYYCKINTKFFVFIAVIMQPKKMKMELLSNLGLAYPGMIMVDIISFILHPRIKMIGHTTRN